MGKKTIQQKNFRKEIFYEKKNNTLYFFPDGSQPVIGYLCRTSGSRGYTGKDSNRTGKEKLTENDLEQVYHYSYESLGKNLPYTKADTLFSDGFTPSSLTVADWKNYEGDIQVTVTDKGGKETVLQAQEKEEVDLTSYGDVQKVALQPDGTIEDDSSFDGLSVSGKADPTKIR